MTKTRSKTKYSWYTGILRDKTIDDKLIYIIIDDKQNYPVDWNDSEPTNQYLIRVPKVVTHKSFYQTFGTKPMSYPYKIILLLKSRSK